MQTLEGACGQEKLWVVQKTLDRRLPKDSLVKVVRSIPDEGSVYTYLLLFPHTGSPHTVVVSCNPSTECLLEADGTLLDTWRAERKKWQQAAPELARDGLTGPSCLSGTDPELFVENGGKVVPAWQFLPSKMAVRQDSLDFSYWDGFQAELGVAPHSCHQMLMDHIWRGLKDLQSHMSGGNLSFKTVVEIDDTVLKEAPMEFVQLGCGTSENAYGLHGELVGDPRDLKWRFAGGHFHLEVPRVLMTPRLAERMVMAADMVAGIPSLLMFQKMDNPIRRVYYGLPGEYRIPPHGIEYRFLSNAWMCHPAVAGFTLGLVRTGLRIGLQEMEWLFDYDPQAVPKILLDGDLDAARKHVDRNQRVYKQLFGAMAKKSLTEYDQDIQAKQVKLVAASMEQLVKPVGDFVPLGSMEENWNLRAGDVWYSQARAEGKQWQSLILGNSETMNVYRKQLRP